MGTGSPNANSLQNCDSDASTRAGNLQLVVNIAKEYSEAMGVPAILAMFESHSSAQGTFLFLGSKIAESENEDEHYEYIVAAVKCNQLPIVEKMTRESEVRCASSPSRRRPTRCVADDGPLVATQIPHNHDHSHPATFPTRFFVSVLTLQVRCDNPSCSSTRGSLKYQCCWSTWRLHSTGHTPGMCSQHQTSQTSVV